MQGFQHDMEHANALESIRVSRESSSNEISEIDRA
jgi:hypothetical protein